MPYNSFPLFGEHDQNYRVGTFRLDNDDEDVPDLRSAGRAWGAAALLIGALFVALILLVPRDDQKSADVVSQLPDGYQSTVAALVRAVGSACTQVCSVARSPVGGTTSLIVACGRTEAAGSCADPARYELRINTVAGR